MVVNTHVAHGAITENGTLLSYQKERVGGGRGALKR